MSTASQHAAPRDTADVVDAVVEATRHGVPLRLRGAGTWLDAGRPVAPDATSLDLGAIRGITEYTPGDLTLTARAGTSLAEIEAATRANGQWLPLDPLGDVQGTLGATFATASAGALAGHLGAPRDLALGVEFVDGAGMVVRGGGRVVKNVAGFDLVRLTVGAWGSLGALTEVTVRLSALPERECTMALQIPREASALGPWLARVRTAPLTPLAMECVDSRLAHALGAGDAAALLVRLAGNVPSVDAQRRHLGGMGEVRNVDDAIWSRLRQAAAGGAATLRLSRQPSRLAELWHDLASIASSMPGASYHASVARGVARLIVPQPEAGALQAAISSLGARWSVAGELLPNEAWESLPPPDDPLSRRVRAAFDPHGVLNPGILVPVS